MRVSDIPKETWDRLLKEEDEGREKARLPKEPMHRGRRMPYVIFGAIEGAGTPDEAPTLVRLNMAANHAQIDMIRMYSMDKGFKILKWWFPTSADYRAVNEKAAMDKTASYEEVQFGLWELLDRECRMQTGSDRIIESKDAKIEALEAKVKEFERKKQ